MIHGYKMKDLNIVLDINSGSVHVVDELTYEMVDLIEKGLSPMETLLTLSEIYNQEEVDEAYKEVESLIHGGQLFSEDTYKDAAKKFNDRETIVKALCLHIAHDCNLTCKYCFASEGEYHGERSMMSEEIGKKALDFLVENSGNRRNLEVDFFGGEPLMNFEVVKRIVSYGRELEKKHNKNFRFTITTNGVLLNDEIMAYIHENMSNVVLSIDGRKEVHDFMRQTLNKKGSYDLILPKFKKMAALRDEKDYYVRGTFTHHNTDFAEDVLHLADLGFKQISVEPVVAPEDMDYALTDSDLPKLKEQYEYLAEKMLEYKEEDKDFNFFHFMIDLNQGPCVVKRLTGCGAGSEYLAVTPWGDLYPCHQFVGLDDFKMGSVFDGIQDKDRQQEFKNCNVYSKEECKDCWAKYYCSGGCMANSFNFHQDINQVYTLGCELQKKRIETAIYMKAKNAGM